MAITPRPQRLVLAVVSALALVAGIPAGSGASDGYLTPEPPMLTLDPSAPVGSSLLPIINSGDTLDDFLFEGIPDGIGVMPGDAPGTVDVFVNHEQTRVPWEYAPGGGWPLGYYGDLADASVSKLTLDTATGGVLAASVVIPASAGYTRFCSSFMAGPAEGFDTYTYFTNEEAPDVLDVPPGAPYGPDPSLAPQRQAGYVVALNAETGEYTQIAGMGRHNHENSVVVPGGWDQIAVLSGDDTYSAPSSQLYLYLADDEDAIWADRGSLWAFRVTRTDEGKVDPKNAFNGANDYGDIESGDVWRGGFIRVPLKIAKGLTSKPPQEALESWSNANNVFQFIRVEDTAYDVNDPRVVYIADTGTSRVIPDPVTGRLKRGPSGTVGIADNGRIFRIEFSADNPRKVVSFSILLDADAGGSGPSAMHQPDNLGTSENSLMVQEDTYQAPGSRVWRYDFASEAWSVVAIVNDLDWESSGIVDASGWFGDGTWLLDVEAHDVFIATDTITVPGVTLKREGGQLLLMTIPES